MQTKSKISFIILLLILALAGFFRFYLIKELPGGLLQEEAENGLKALEISESGEKNLFYGREKGTEILYLRLASLSIKAFGASFWQLKVISGIISMITLIGLYLLTKLLYKRTVAFLACFFAAVSIPYTILSRIAFRAILIPCITVYLLYFAIKAVKGNKKKYFYAFLAGTLFALGFYTHISFWTVPLFLLVLLIVEESIFSSKKSNLENQVSRPRAKLIRIHYKKILTALIAFAILITPLFIYFIEKPGILWDRARDASILNPGLPHNPLYSLGKNIVKTLVMFNAYGDPNWRYNIAGAPFFDPATGILFLIGILVCVFAYLKKKRISKKTLMKNGLLIIWFLVMLIPSLITSKDTPNFLAAVNLIPLIFIFPSLGMRAILLKIRHRPIILGFLLLILAVFVVNYNLWIYFKVAKNNQNYYNTYNGDLTSTALYINKNNNKENTFLVLGKDSNQIMQFLTSEQKNPYRLIIPEKINKYSYPKNVKIIFPSKTLSQIEEFKKAHAEAELIFEEYNRFGEKGMEVYQF